jgi:hypothetical protein
MTVAKLTIGHIARSAGVNIETVRYYQRRGLVPLPPKRALVQQMALVFTNPNTATLTAAELPIIIFSKATLCVWRFRAATSLDSTAT